MLIIKHYNRGYIFFFFFKRNLSEKRNVTLSLHIYFFFWLLCLFFLIFNNSWRWAIKIGTGLDNPNLRASLVRVEADRLPPVSTATDRLPPLLDQKTKGVHPKWNSWIRPWYQWNSKNHKFHLSSAIEILFCLL